jgi:hypothetical protein
MMRGSFVATALFALGFVPACGEIETVVDAPSGQIDAPAGQIDAPDVVIDAPIDAMPMKRVFISSQVFFGDFGGPVAADTACQNMATAAGLPGNYRAWVSTQSNSVVGRFTQAQVPYVMTDGTTIASNWTDLTDGNIAHGIDRNEAGNVLPNTGITNCHGSPTCFQTYTGTNPDGTAFTGDDQCLNWSTRIFDAGGGNLNTFSGGDSTMAGREWTLRASGFRCDYQARIYCFQQ